MHRQGQHGRIAYQWSHGPCEQPLVVLHGLGDSAIHTYALRFPSTSLNNTPSLFIDLPGFGESPTDASHPGTIEAMAEDIAGLLDALDVQPMNVFAHSMGANVALLLAQRLPQRIPNLILAEPLLKREDSVLAAGIAKFSEESFVSRGYSMFVRATSIQARRGEIASAAFLSTLKMANPVILHRAAVSLLEQREPDFLELLWQLKSPPTILVGGNSNPDTDQLDQSGIRIISVPNAGHFMFAEQPEATAYAIFNLVTGLHYGESSNCCASTPSLRREGMGCTER